MRLASYFSFVFCFLSFSIAYGQGGSFFSTYNTGHNLERIISTNDGNYLLCIWDSANGIRKVDPNGLLIWEKRISYPLLDATPYINGVIQTSDSGYVVEMTGVLNTTQRIVIWKSDKNGNFLWTKEYYNNNSDIGDGLCSGLNGGFVFSGGGCSGNNFIISCDASGNILWQKQYVEVNAAYSASRLFLDGANIIAFGNYASLSSPTVVLGMFSLDLASGNINWFRHYPSQGVHELPSTCKIAETSDNGFVVTGQSLDSITSFYRVFVLKTDSAGNLLYYNIYSNNKGTGGSDIAVLQNGNIVVTGSAAYTDNRNTQMMNMCVDPVVGNVIWCRTGGNIVNNGAGNDLSVGCVADGNYFYTCGIVCDSVGDGFFDRLDSNGYGWCNEDTLIMTKTARNIVQVNSSITINQMPFVSGTLAHFSSSGSVQQSVSCTYMNNVQVMQNDNSYSFFFYPSPGNGKCNLNSSEKIVQLIVSDVSGRALTKIIRPEPDVNIDFSPFGKGIYFATAIFENGYIGTTCFIIQ
jgi:hypothetical protein